MDLLDAGQRVRIRGASPRRSRAIADAGPRRRRAAAPAGERADELRRRALADAPPPPAKMDLRNYGIGAQILRDLNVGRMRLLAKPRKMPSMAGFDLEVTGYEERRRRAPRGVAARSRRRPSPCPSHRPDARGDGRRVAHRPVALQPRDRRRPARGRAARARGGGRRRRRHHASSTVPGALESPLALQRFAQTGDYRRAGRARRGDPRRDAITSRSCANESAAGVSSVQLEFGIPIGNGILTCDTEAQALARMDAEGLRGGAGRARARQPARRRSMSDYSPRRRARELVLQGLYERQLAGNAARRDRRRPRRRATAISAPTRPISTSCGRGVGRRLRRAARARRAASRSLARRVCRRSSARCLVIGAWELVHRAEIPYRVVINEAVELAKRLRRHRRPQVTSTACWTSSRPTSARRDRERSRASAAQF